MNGLGDAGTKLGASMTPGWGWGWLLGTTDGSSLTPRDGAGRSGAGGGGVKVAIPGGPA